MDEARIDPLDGISDTESGIYRALFEQMSEGFALHEILCDQEGKPLDYRFLKVNSAFERITGMSRNDIIGRTVREVIPGIEPYWIDTYGKVALTGKPARFHNRSEDLGKHFEVFAFSPAHGQFACLFIDITEQKRMELALVRACEAAELRAAEAEESRRILEALMEHVPEGITVADGLEPKVRLRSRHGWELCGLPRRQWNLAFVAHSPELELLYHVDGVTPAQVEETPLVRAARHGEVVTDEEWVLVRPDGEAITLLCNAGPIRNREGALTGAVSVWRDIRALKSTRKALEEAYNREHRIADVLQRSLVPAMVFDLPDYAVVARFQPRLKEAEVGGDFHDIFGLEDGRLAVVMGDVSGKGLIAATHTAMTKYMLRAYAHKEPEPAHVMEHLNEAMCEYAPEELFVTLFYGVLDPASGAITYANAGQWSPLLRRRESGDTLRLEATGPAIGVIQGAGYDQRTADVAPGDILLLYTDGIIDARSHGRFLEVEDLVEVLASNENSGEGEIINAVFDTATSVADGELTDDAAVLVIRVRPRAA